MFHHEVPVEDHGFHLSQMVVVAIEVSPSSLDHSDLRVGELVNGLVQELRVGNKVRVKDGDELTCGHLQSGVEGARLESKAIVTMQVMNVDALPAQGFDRLARHVLGFIGGVIQQLNLQQLGGVPDLGHRLDQPLNHKHLVVDRQLDRDCRQRLESGWLRYTPSVSQIQVDQLIAM